MKAQDALRAAIPQLTAAGIDNAPRDARLLLAHVMGIAADRLTLHLPDSLSPPAQAAYAAAITARSNRQPVSQITGQRQFWGRSFKVTQDTLDPRPETEILVAEALSRPFLKMLDLGTGTGCILLSCLADMPMASGTGSDLSAKALDVAQENATTLNLSARAKFIQSDWCANIQGRFDLITCNPPYIAADEMPHLSPDVLQWEPHAALTPGGDGLDAYRKIAAQAPARLMPQGRLLLEIGPTQSAAVTALLNVQGLINIRTLQDLDGRDRVVCAQKSQDPDFCGNL
ncbi:peptide chain release factor N(5)-glutamine methyltransferase [Cypionkella sp.]|uniref:peptide chain release factor N(5)-glutamine methyltransferase n=1 Tax=Cypionkella sp. TaxID=2811411 RepID=UPI002ABB47F1|nr:peptide chain release factor N(5)-glutamine methyltransferase [Cypionkella sp.]MDZ4395449.1 peptide chain release factor N(5)-glutamine methyltransferase [Cypionkella sp.]